MLFYGNTMCSCNMYRFGYNIYYLIYFFRHIPPEDSDIQEELSWANPGNCVECTSVHCHAILSLKTLQAVNPQLICSLSKNNNKYSSLLVLQPLWIKTNPWHYNVVN
jgi:hypothetical protein